MTSKHRLKVGVDFGTTFSGISWIHTSRPDEVNVVMRWPGTTRTFAKVPSEISYTSNGTVHRWGYQIRLSDERVAWFKLLLQPTESTSSNSPVATGARSLAGTKEPVDIVADYLSCLREHFLVIIRESLGEAFLDATPIDYTLTVPAIWGDAAKASTLEAAGRAGFGNADEIKLMSEPDAAAAWSLLRDITPNELRVGDAFVIVDCGGGTVDLISYEVQNLEPLTAKECAKGTGGMCGSVFLNERFKDLVRSRIGSRFDTMRTATKQRMMREWEEVLKPEFSNSEEDDIFSCPIGGIPDDPDMRIEDGDFLITREEMLAIFDPVIHEIIPLVQQQIDTVEGQNEGKLHISAILLVGGFGGSRYLSQRLRSELQEARGTRHSSIEILQPTNAWSAVSRGAALGIRISSRKARRHYGVSCGIPFILGKHNIDNLYFDAYNGDALCKNWIRWGIKKGDQVSEDEPRSFGFSRSVPLSNDLHFTDNIYFCDNDQAPEFTNGSDSSLLGEPTIVYSDLSMIPRNLFEQKIGKNLITYYHICYQVVVTIRSGDVHFELEFQGTRYGTAIVRYVHD